MNFQKTNNFEERSSIKDDMLEEVFEEAKEGNLELIREKGEILETKVEYCEKFN